MLHSTLIDGTSFVAVGVAPLLVLSRVWILDVCAAPGLTVPIQLGAAFQQLKICPLPGVQSPVVVSAEEAFGPAVSRAVYKTMYTYTPL